MCSGKCGKQEPKGKKYTKPKFMLSSLIFKRRENRRRKGINLFLDAVLSNSIQFVQNEAKLYKQKRRQVVTERSVRKNIENEKANEEEIERICGIDSFLNELHSVRLDKKNIIGEQNDSTGTYLHDIDHEINNMVSNFIENGSLD